ncbi:hypothetical protein ACFV6B_39380 [Streptomyces microflavus]|uniref:hypothetical protein n=1 Tax=Streptomyces microflavus TaxID=1919 RepID=UPI0036514C08
MASLTSDPRFATMTFVVIDFDGLTPAARPGEPIEVDVVWNPEPLREGHAVEDTLRSDRLIADVSIPGGEKAVRAVYPGIIDAGVPFFVTSPSTA